MPPKGYRKHPKTEESSDTNKQKPTVTVETKPAMKDDLGPKTTTVSDTTEHAAVTIVWRDTRGRQRTTQYIMSDLTINENVHEEFSGAKKKTHLHISLDGAVLEKI